MQINLIILLVAFLVLLVVLERFNSLKTLLRLILTIAFICIYCKEIADGKTIGIASLILVVGLSAVNILIKNGIHKKTLSELISVLITSFATGLIVWLVSRRAKLNLFKDEVMRFNGVRSPNGVMFGLYIIVTLGIFMDIVSRINYHLDEEKDKTADITWKEQFLKGIEIGRKYIGEKINTIIFMILGVSLFSICMNINRDIKIYDMLKQHEIFAYFLIAIVANIGVLLSVPITACIYACLNRKKTIYKTVSENKVDGKRSLKL